MVGLCAGPLLNQRLSVSDSPFYCPSLEPLFPSRGVCMCSSHRKSKNTDSVIMLPVHYRSDLPGVPLRWTPSSTTTRRLHRDTTASGVGVFNGVTSFVTRAVAGLNLVKGCINIDQEEYREGGRHSPMTAGSE